MSRAPFIVIADDLTGAAEIAAIGHRHGLTAVVIPGMHPRMSGVQADLLVLDTDSRLDDARDATEKITAFSAALANQPRALLYKKTDSVLRGPVRAELETLARALNLQRVLLVPANPALGRTVRSGRYAVGSVPLHETAFAQDPHHPAKTDAVRDLLGRDGVMEIIASDRGTPLPAAGIVVGDATSPSEVDDWARRAAPDFLLAGAGEFFSALLRARGFAEQHRSSTTTVEEPILVISGTTSPAGTTLRQEADRAGVPMIQLPAKILDEPADTTGAIDEWVHAVQARLSTAGRAIAVFDAPVSSDAAVGKAIRRTFARLAAELLSRQAVRHLVIEGGATAAAIVRAVGWRELRLIQEWAPGVASLRPESGGITLTLKPGSYAWPAALWQNVLGSDRKSFRA